MRIIDKDWNKTSEKGYQSLHQKISYQGLIQTSGYVNRHSYIAIAMHACILAYSYRGSYIASLLATSWNVKDSMQVFM